MLTIVKKKKQNRINQIQKKIDIDHNVDVCFSCGLARKKINNGCFIITHAYKIINAQGKNKYSSSLIEFILNHLISCMIHEKQISL